MDPTVPDPDSDPQHWLKQSISTAVLLLAYPVTPSPLAPPPPAPPLRNRQKNMPKSLK
jgi:hypothetical protein